MDEYDIYIRGFTGRSAGAAERGLSRMFGLDARRAREFVQSLPRVVKRHVPASRALDYERALQELGAEYELRRSPIRPTQIIAVAGGAKSNDGQDPEQHGSTLTLTLATPDTAGVSGRAIAADAAAGVRRSPQFAQTVVDKGLPYGLAAQRDASQVAGAPGSLDRGASPVAGAPAGAPRELDHVLRAPPPGRGTWREGSPSSVEPALPAAPAAQAPSAAPNGPSWPPRSAAPPSAGPEHGRGDRIVDPGPAKVAPPSYGPSAWASLEPSVRAPAVAPVRAPAAIEPWAGFADSSTSNPQPLRHASRQPQELELDGRPGWLVRGPDMFETDALSAPPGAAPELDVPRASARAPSARAPAAWQPPFALPESAEPPAIPAGTPARPDERAAPAERETARPHSVRPAAARPQPPARAVVGGSPVRAATGHNVGVYLGRDVDDEEPSALLRFALRAGLGVSLFVILTTVRQCRAIDSDVQDELAKWGEQPAVEIAARGRAPVDDGPVTYGPPALDWLESDLHQVTSGDKDRVRSLVRRYKDAGATEVYMGNVMRSGMMQIAGELIIELPSDASARKAVIAEHDRVLEGHFGGFAPRTSDPQGPVLRMTI